MDEGREAREVERGQVWSGWPPDKKTSDERLLPASAPEAGWLVLVMKRNDGENGDELTTKSGRLWGAISGQTVASV